MSLEINCGCKISFSHFIALINCISSLLLISIIFCFVSISYQEMRNSSAAVVLLMLLSLVQPGKSGQPNVVFVLADDYGYNDIGYHGSEIKTPTLDEVRVQAVLTCPQLLTGWAMTSPSYLRRLMLSSPLLIICIISVRPATG